MKIAILVGNPKPQSRTLQTAESVAAVVESLIPEVRPQRLVIELAGHADRLFAWPEPKLDELTAEVAGSDVLIVASPTYKATYTGMLKAFLDRYGSNGLAGVVAVPVMTGAAGDHALAVENHLRPLLVELGATVPARGLYMVMPRMDELSAVTAAWGAAAAPVLRPAIAARLSSPEGGRA
ncbi:NADPH-dependent FMN reductase [Actinoplanes sp. N902-109]|uniref:NADPH-dependent FMN reductase n=1 Tax=Actinoplanes sp. (strain N902-109) TaxID=649831 RepID=UPI0003293B93|nr:NAD(P)H-dependent oxidoreductase [Actinoplanes sp. N902-109]AGL17342.1 NADPH-dependent FMN reductase [Actinoplanes sp. N902-109]